MGRSLRGQFNGVVRYTHELTSALAPTLGNELIVLLTRAPDGLDGLSVTRVRAPFPTPNEYARALWEQTIVPAQVSRFAPDVYHSPNYILPLAIRCPTVVTVHDLHFFDVSLHRRRSHLYLSFLTTRAVRMATRVICVSDDTRDALVERFPEVAAKVRVVSEGVNERFRPASQDEILGFRRRHGLNRPMVLFVGTVEPRKNIPRLVRAFSHAVTSGDLPHELVLVGGDGWKNDAVWAAIDSSSARERIRVLGYLDEAELRAAYSAADVFAFPSLGEGFGLPPIEAMACGTPTLTANTGAIPEIVGDAAWTVEPTDTEALSDALLRLLKSASERERLATAGRQRAAQFSWSAVAAATLEVYREVAVA
jgi:glycosyltransferase involved in cell wall biosynthesis